MIRTDILFLFKVSSLETNLNSKQPGAGPTFKQSFLILCVFYSGENVLSQLPQSSVVTYKVFVRMRVCLLTVKTYTPTSGCLFIDLRGF